MRLDLHMFPFAKTISQEIREANQHLHTKVMITHFEVFMISIQMIDISYTRRDIIDQPKILEIVRWNQRVH